MTALATPYAPHHPCAGRAVYRDGPKRKPALRGVPERNALAMNNRGLVYNLVNHYYRRRPHLDRWYPREDAEADGHLGLLRAAELWDEASGYAFSTYATRWILQHVIRGAWHARLIKLPDYGTPAEKEVWAAGSAVKCLSGVGRASKNGRLGPIRGDDGNPWLEGLPCPRTDPEAGLAAALTAERRDALRDAMRFLPAKDRELLRLRFEENLTLDEAGARFGVTRERARQVQERALRRLGARIVALGYEPLMLPEGA